MQSLSSMKFQKYMGVGIVALLLMAFASTASAQSKHWVGTWKSNETNVVMIFSKQDGKLVLDATDGTDGEVLEVKELSGSGKELTYTMRTPSTDFTITSHAVLKGKRKFDEEFKGYDGDIVRISYDKQ
jgi:hypothetical protein